MLHDGRMTEPTPDPLERVSWPVPTDRLVLRRAMPDDVASTWAIRRQPAVQEWIGRAPATFEEYRTHFLDAARQRATVVVLLDGVVIGDLMIRVTDAWAQAEVRDLGVAVEAELGWTLDPARGGHGYATEAARAAVDLCFGPLGLRRVVASCFADNAPSWRLMERLGMRRESHAVRDGLHRSGRWLDGYTYALLREEWPGR